MKTLFNALNGIVLVIAVLVFASGLTITVLGGYDFIHAFAFFPIVNSDEGAVGLMAVHLLKAVDLFLIAIVFFVFALGILILFNNKTEKVFPDNFPAWLRIKDFIQLKIILWEAILTTLVISSLADLAETKLQGNRITIDGLIVPGVVLLIALSLFFLKKGEHGNHV